MLLPYTYYSFYYYIKNIKNLIIIMLLFITSNLIHKEYTQLILNMFIIHLLLWIFIRKTFLKQSFVLVFISIFIVFDSSYMKTSLHLSMKLYQTNSFKKLNK